MRYKQGSSDDVVDEWSPGEMPCFLSHCSAVDAYQRKVFGLTTGANYTLGTLDIPKTGASDCPSIRVAMRPLQMLGYVWYCLVWVVKLHFKQLPPEATSSEVCKDATTR